MIESLHLNYGEQIATDMVDIFKDYAPPPLNYMPDLYPKMVRMPRAWGLGFHLSDGRERARVLAAGAWPYVQRSARKLVSQHPCDLIVSAHPLANAPVLRALGRQRPLFITVVTDLITAHSFWFHRDVDLCLVPTEATRQRALRCGLSPAQVRTIGLPVADRFCQPVGDRLSLRQRLGWPADRPVVILMGGGEGMGPLERTALALEGSGLPVATVIITGRNQDLKQRLEARNWSMPAFIYGFVRDMPDFMAAADILVTKAGPGTITEALNAGLPMILYSRLPGQEDGNVIFVVSEKAGVWAPTPERITHALREWIEDPRLLASTAQNARRLANPHASRQIAGILANSLGVNPLQQNPLQTRSGSLKS